MDPRRNLLTARLRQEVISYPQDFMDLFYTLGFDSVVHIANYGDVDDFQAIFPPQMAGLASRLWHRSESLYDRAVREVAAHGIALAPPSQRSSPYPKSALVRPSTAPVRPTSAVALVPAPKARPPQGSGDRFYSVAQQSRS